MEKQYDEVVFQEVEETPILEKTTVQIVKEKISSACDRIKEYAEDNGEEIFAIAVNGFLLLSGASVLKYLHTLNKTAKVELAAKELEFMKKL